MQLVSYNTVLTQKIIFARRVNIKKSAHLGSFHQILVLGDNVCTSQVHLKNRVEH